MIIFRDAAVPNPLLGAFTACYPIGILGSFFEEMWLGYEEH
jgi:hypothetical protein